MFGRIRKYTYVKPPSRLGLHKLSVFAPGYVNTRVIFYFFYGRCKNVYAL